MILHMILYIQRGEEMAKIEKIIEKMQRQPNGIRPEEATMVLNHFGWWLERQSGSHMQFLNDTGNIVTIQKRTPLRAVYVKDILRRIGR